MALGLPLFGYRNAVIGAIEFEFGVIGWFCKPGDEARLLRWLLDGGMSCAY